MAHLKKIELDKTGNSVFNDLLKRSFSFYTSTKDVEDNLKKEHKISIHQRYKGITWKAKNEVWIFLIHLFLYVSVYLVISLPRFTVTEG